jgi:hypothetical protein
MPDRGTEHTVPTGSGYFLGSIRRPEPVSATQKPKGRQAAPISPFLAC